MDHQLNARIDRILAETAAVRGGMQRLNLQGEQIMATQQQVLSVLADVKSTVAKAQVAIGALEAENADLKSQLAAATSKAGSAIDGDAIDGALNDAAASAKALSDAIPAGTGETVTGTTNDGTGTASVGTSGTISNGPATQSGPAVDNLGADAAVVGTASGPAVSDTGSQATVTGTAGQS